MNVVQHPQIIQMRIISIKVQATSSEQW